MFDLIFFIFFGVSFLQKLISHTQGTSLKIFKLVKKIPQNDKAKHRDIICGKGGRNLVNKYKGHLGCIFGCKEDK
jgi:hypothetical protein